MKRGTQIQFPRGKCMAEIQAQIVLKIRKTCGENVVVFYFLYFENKFLELISNLTFMPILQKQAPKNEGGIHLENLCHLKGNMCQFPFTILISSWKIYISTAVPHVHKYFNYCTTCT